jgi:hypothetical protein
VRAVQSTPLFGRAGKPIGMLVTCNTLTLTIDWTTATDGYVVTLTPM